MTVFGFSNPHYQMVIALPNGNADDEPQRHGKWSWRRLPVETSVDKSDAEPSQTGVK